MSAVFLCTLLGQPVFQRLPISLFNDPDIHQGSSLQIEAQSLVDSGWECRASSKGELETRSPISPLAWPGLCLHTSMPYCSQSNCDSRHFTVTASRCWLSAFEEVTNELDQGHSARKWCSKHLSNQEGTLESLIWVQRLTLGRWRKPGC